MWKMDKCNNCMCEIFTKGEENPLCEECEEIEELRNKVKRYENTLCLLLNYATEYDQDTYIDIITDTFNGFDMMDKYKEEIKEGTNILEQWLVEG